MSKPLVDLTEPPLNWLNTHPLSFDSLHSSNAYGYSFNPPSAAHIPPPENPIPITSTSSFLYGQNSDAVPSANLVEANPYYPSYVSPTKYTYDDYAQSLSGLWDPSREWEFGKKIELGESFRSKEMNVSDLSIYPDYADQGAHSSKGLSTFEQNNNKLDMLGSEQHQGSINREQLDYKSFTGQISEFMPVEFSRKSVHGSTSFFPETYSLTSYEQGRSWKHQTPYGASCEKGAKQHGISPNVISSVKKSSSGLVVKSQTVSASPSAPSTGSFNNLENSGGANNTDFASNDNLSNMKEFYPLHSSEGKVHFDAGQVSFHLEGDNHSFPKLPLEKKEKLSSNVNVIKDPLKEKSGLQIPDIGPGSFSLMLASNGAISCLEGSSESLDLYNPAVDSPCWKGAPVYHCPVESSGPVTPQLINKIEACSGSNSIGPTDNSVKICPQKPSDYSFYQKHGYLENDSESSPKRSSHANLLFEEHGYDHDLKAGSYQMKSSCGLGVQFSDYIDKPRQDCVQANNSADEFKFKPFHLVQYNSVEDKLTFEKKCELGSGIADVGISSNGTSEGCSSHVPLHATEHVLSSLSSVEAAPAKLTKLHGEELAPQMCVRTLISTMHNLSELLLFHCSNDMCELREHDFGALKQAVNNLDKCISKRMGSEAPLQESLLTQKSSQFIREFPELHEGVTVSSPQETKAAFSVLNQSNYQHVQEQRSPDITSAKKSEKCSDFTSRGGDAERVKGDDTTQVLEDDAKRVKNDNMTQAIKKVLIDNFVEEEDEKLQILLYKNLWLEAEAALCSINYKARFDRMKIELEKCKLLKAKDLSENNTELEKLSESTFSPDLNADYKLPPEVKDDSTQDVSVHDSPIANTSSHPDDVVARFQILKCQESKSYANQRPTTDEVDKILFEARNDQTPHISTCSLSNASSTSKADDVEASVIARLHILKNRVENSSCSNMGDQLLPQVAFKLFENGTLNVNTEPELQQNSSNHMQDKLTVKEFHLGDTVIQSPRLNKLGNQLPASCYDSSSSDWEHVLKEELPAQNC